jgi:hypothetical protein
MSTVIRRVIAPPEAPQIVSYEQGPVPPQSAGEWVQQRIENLGTLGRWGAGAVVVELLQAVDDKALRAAVAAGAGLDEWARHAVGEWLREYRDHAVDDYAPAVAHMDRIRGAWVKRWGSDRPRNLPTIREFPAEGTGASEPFGGWPEMPASMTKSGVYRRDDRGVFRAAG